MIRSSGFFLPEIPFSDPGKMRVPKAFDHRLRVIQRTKEGEELFLKLFCADRSESIAKRCRKDSGRGAQYGAGEDDPGLVSGLAEQAGTQHDIALQLLPGSVFLRPCGKAPHQGKRDQ